MGVRPEDISLASNLPDDAETFETEATVREPLGELLLLHCQLGNDEIHVEVEPQSKIQPGEIIEVGFNEEQLHLFDTSSSDALYHSTTPETVESEATPTE